MTPPPSLPPHPTPVPHRCAHEISKSHITKRVLSKLSSQIGPNHTRSRGPCEPSWNGWAVGGGGGRGGKGTSSKPTGMWPAPEGMSVLKCEVSNIHGMYTHTCVHTHVYKNLCTHVHTCKYAHPHTHTHICTNTMHQRTVFTYSYKYVHTCTHICKSHSLTN